jgi:hypothetical protein
MKKSIKNTLVESIVIFKKNTNNAIIINCIKNFFKGLFIIKRSEITPKKNIAK